MNIDDLIDAAKAARGVTSDRALCDLLGVSGATVSHYRTRRIWPDDAMAVKLAELANIDATEVLLHLAIWRTSGNARLTWERALMRFRNIASIGVLALVILAAPQDAVAKGEERGQNCLTSNISELYIMRYLPTDA